MGNFNRDRGVRGGFGGDHRGRGGFGGGHGRGFGGGRGGDREMFTATCSNCGKECQVPFRPTNSKPVYCSDCFEKMGGGGDSRRQGRSDFQARPQGNDQSKAQMDAINAKLDKILSILAPTPAPVAVEEEAVSEIKPEKTEKKAKKSIKKVAPKEETEGE